MDIGMWRAYEIATLPPATVQTILDLAWALAEQLKRRPTAEELQQAARARP